MVEAESKEEKNMESAFQNLKNKEVINSANGHRLGFVSEVIVDAADARLVGLRLPFCSQTFVIPWACIEHIGKDLIVVTLKTEPH